MIMTTISLHCDKRSVRERNVEIGEKRGTQCSLRVRLSQMIVMVISMKMMVIMMVIVMIVIVMMMVIVTIVIVMVISDDSHD